MSDGSDSDSDNDQSQITPGSDSDSDNDQSQITPDTEMEYEVEKILFHQIVHGVLLYYIKWKKCDMNSNTWEPEENLENCPNILANYKEQHKL